ncbi:MAG: rhomboid family intramembrane serine protease [archaeon]|nr:MAG: rhomboid family intramembrane serine protease [archaeon]
MNRPGTRPWINWGLIGLNLIIFVAELVLTGNFSAEPTYYLFINFGVVPYFILQAFRGVGILSLATLVTSQFLHAGFWHVAGNMLFLFVFGDNVEDRFGHVKYLAFYLAAGVIGGLAQVYISAATGPPDIYIPGVGASGAISGALAAYLVFYPKAQVISLLGYFIAPVRAYWFIGGWFLLQLLLSSGGVDTGVAYAAHIGGFVSGLAIAGAVRLLRGRLEPEN